MLKVIRGNKYGNRKTTVGGITFHSAKEAARYKELLLMKLAGELKDLELQPSYVLEVDGIRICIYRGDFRYRTKEGKWICEDVKGHPTDVFKLKWKVVKAMLRYRDTEFRLV